MKCSGSTRAPLTATARWLDPAPSALANQDGTGVAIPVPQNNPGVPPPTQGVPAMSTTIPALALTRVCAHLRNLCKAADVLGCSRNKPVTKEAHVSLVFKDGGSRFVTFQGSDGSDMEMPIAIPDSVPLAVRLALVGLRPADIGTGSTADNAAEVARLTEALAIANDRAETQAKSALEAQANARQAQSDCSAMGKRLSAECSSDAAKQRLEERAKLRAALGESEMEVRNLRAQLAVAQHQAAPRGEDAATDDNLAERQAAARKRLDETAPQILKPETPPVVVATDADAPLSAVFSRPDVECEHVNGRVVRLTFNGGRQGAGVGDKLKAAGFSFKARTSSGALVWARK